MAELLLHFLVSLSAVFFVVDPLGVAPIFLAITRGDPPDKARSMARRACVAAFGLLVFFALFGTVLFQIFGITLGAFRVAGGFLLLVTALDMLRAKPSATRTTPEEAREATAKEDVALVPLAIPLLSGPGAIATVMVLMSRGKSPAYAGAVLVSIALTCLASYLILRGAGLLQRVLGTSGLAILERVMGLLLAAIAVQFMADGGRALMGA